jgi:hypothetical protein
MSEASHLEPYFNISYAHYAIELVENVATDIV